MALALAFSATWFKLWPMGRSFARSASSGFPAILLSTEPVDKFVENAASNPSNPPFSTTLNGLLRF
jgi:hypothetical protein